MSPVFRLLATNSSNLLVSLSLLYLLHQVLVCTSTLAWGVNFPAHLVVVKGTEFFDGKLGRYVDFPVTDVLQMMVLTLLAIAPYYTYSRLTT
jgi:hypothetical protein